MENDGGSLRCVYAAWRDEQGEFYTEVRSICVVFAALVQLSSMGVLRFQVTSLQCLLGVIAGMYMDGSLSYLGVAQKSVEEASLSCVWIAL